MEHLKTLIGKTLTDFHFACDMMMFSNRPWANVRHFEDPDGKLTECRFPLHEHDIYMRAEVRDLDGKTAFTQVFALK